MVDSQWLYIKASDVTNLWEYVYSRDLDHKESVDAFLERLLKVSGAQSINLYRLDNSGLSFVKEAGSGVPVFDSIRREDIESTFDFAGYCNTEIIHPNWIRNVGPTCQLKEPLPTCLLSTGIVDADQIFIVYVYESLSNNLVYRDLCNVTSRELLHLYRASRLREQSKILKSFLNTKNLNTKKQHVLFDVLLTMKSFFSADGVSIIESHLDRNNQLVFEKTFVERARKGVDHFSGAKGLAHYSVTNKKALLINIFDDDANPYGTGFAFNPEQLIFGKGQGLRIEPIRAPHSTENEKSLMYFPFKYGDQIGAIKVSDFTQYDRFDLRDLRALEVFAEPIATLFAYLSIIANLRAEIESKDAQAQMLDVAEYLFFYREITLGIFHQVSNHLATLASEFLMLETLTNGLGDKATELSGYIREAKGHMRLAQELIASSQQRGFRLAPLEQTCKLIRDVIRPAIQYARKRTESTRIEITYSLSNEEYKVKLDIELAKECIINLLNNAIWAVKSNASAKKEIFIAVRKTTEGRRVRISIQDSGVGIEPEVFKQLFTAGFTTRPGGTGLGLYFTRKLIEHFGGTVNIVRSQPGRGTTVELVLPLSDG